MYKRSISNLAWSKEYDTEMYQFLSDNNFEGIEIAPSRVFGENPYSKVNEAKEYKRYLRENYNLEVSSMQSIWFGRTENLFNSVAERENLFEYTKKAIEFAKTLECKNLVFGCPKNRNIINTLDKKKCLDNAVDFFRRLGKIAILNDTVLSIEANPIIYKTNFINTTEEAIEFIKYVKSEGIKINLDTGTIIQNSEIVSYIVENVKLVNHVHISEPYLKLITYNKIQKEIIDCFSKYIDYCGYLSIEIAMSEINEVKTIIKQFINQGS